MIRAIRIEPHQRYFAFIRAINVGGRRLSNEELKKPFLQVGFRDVDAYQAAGNITFSSHDPDGALIRQLQAAMTEAYGFESPVFVRSHTELSAITRARPFGDEELAATEGRVQVSLMHVAPDETARAEVLELVPLGERIVFSDREFFWLPARGISDSRLPVSTIERLVGPMAMRTLGTIERMFHKFS